MSKKPDKKFWSLLVKNLDTEEAEWYSVWDDKLRERLAAQEFSKGDKILVDTLSGEIQNLTQQKVYQVPPLPPFIQGIIKAGGLMPYVTTHSDD